MKELDCQALNYELMKNKIKFRVADTQSDMANERLRREKKTSWNVFELKLGLTFINQ